MPAACRTRQRLRGIGAVSVVFNGGFSGDAAAGFIDGGSWRQPRQLLVATATTRRQFQRPQPAVRRARPGIPCRLSPDISRNSFLSAVVHGARPFAGCLLTGSTSRRRAGRTCRNAKIVIAWHGVVKTPAPAAVQAQPLASAKSGCWVAYRDEGRHRLPSQRRDPRSHNSPVQRPRHPPFTVVAPGRCSASNHDL